MLERDDMSLLAHAVELAPDGVLVVGPDGRIVYANRAMAALAAREDLVGGNVDELVPDAVRARHGDLRAAYSEAPTQRPMGAGLELALQRRDGELIPVEIALSPFDHGQRFVIASVRDIRDRLDGQRRLNHAHEQLALVAERERIGRDLHDVVLQHLYGMGLTAQAIAAGSEAATALKLEAVVDDIDRIISEVRTIVFTLGSAGRRGSLGQELADVVAQASRVLGFTPSLRMAGPVETALPDGVRTEMVASMREALGNVARHAQASQAGVTIALRDGFVVMSVVDNGVGPPIDDESIRRGHGLGNLMARARAFGGSCELVARDDGGAELRWCARY